MMPRMPAGPDGWQMVCLALAMSTMTTIYGYAAWATPHIIRYLT